MVKRSGAAPETGPRRTQGIAGQHLEMDDRLVATRDEVDDAGADWVDFAGGDDDGARPDEGRFTGLVKKCPHETAVIDLLNVTRDIDLYVVFFAISHLLRR